MTRAEFWKIVNGTTRLSGMKRLKAIQKRLAQLPPKESVLFARHILKLVERANRADLWGAA